MTPTRRTALLVAAAGLAALVVPPLLALLAALAVLAAAVVDALSVRRRPELAVERPEHLARGVAAPLRVAPAQAVRGRIRLRQPAPPDVRVEPAEADGALEASVVALRRGRHVLAEPALRLEGPLGLGAWHHRAGGEQAVVVWPDLPAAARLARAVRTGRFRETGRQVRGPLGLGTELESIRDYLPDDDIRQVNWPATARVGRPMSNQYRVEQDRDVVCVVDAGRLMAAPLGDRTRLDAAVDAAAALAAVADALGDRCGAIAFDDEVRRLLPPRRRGARAVVQALHDVEPSTADSDYELAFRQVGRGKRAFVLVLTDLLEETAARPLLEAMPVLARRHAVCVASAGDAGLEDLVRREPDAEADVYAAAAALDVLAARRQVAARLRRAGATLVEAPPARLGTACVGAYLRAKARARL